MLGHEINVVFIFSTFYSLTYYKRVQCAETASQDC